MLTISVVAGRGGTDFNKELYGTDQFPEKIQGLSALDGLVSGSRIHDAEEPSVQL